MANATEAVKRFVDAINASDVQAIGELLTEDHQFIDAMGQMHAGRDKMTQGWKMYFHMVRDYAIEIDCTISEDNRVGLFGWARGTCGGTSWRFPAAWKAEVRDGQLSEWRIYADIEPMLRSMGVQRSL